MAGGIINTGSFALGLFPEGLIGFDKGLKDFATEYDKVFHVRPMDRAYLRWAKTYGVGLPVALGEAAGVTYDHMGQRWKQDIVAIKYGLGLAITDEAIMDDRSGIIMQKKSTELAKAMAKKREVLAAAFLDACWTSGDSNAGDGVALYSASHPIISGVFSNVPSAPAALSEASLEQAVQDIARNMVNERGLKAAVMAKKLVVSVTNQFEAQRIFKSAGQVYTPDNTINALKEAGDIGNGNVQVMHYLNSANAYHILTDVNDDEGFVCYVRFEPKFSADNEFDNDVAKFKAIMKLGFSVLDPRCSYGVYVA